MAAKPKLIYQIKITLQGARPPIWRRILVESNITFGKLHDIIQIVMGWDNSHLHMFNVGERIIGDPADDEFGEFRSLDEMRQRLGKMVPKAGQKFDYEYDFGDSWDHTLLVEKILPYDPNIRLPVCIKGKRACPPDDIGGVWGYELFLEAIADPNHSEHDQYLEWIGGEFDPEAFDIEAINAELSLMGQRRPSPDNREEFEPPMPEVRGPELLAWEKGLNPGVRQAADELPVRRDMLTFLDYLKNNSVRGTQATGNMPIKAVKAILAGFVSSLEMNGSQVQMNIRSELDEPYFVFVHMLAVMGELVVGDRGKRWQVTSNSEAYISAPPAIQAWLLFQIWWSQLDWSYDYPLSPEGYSTLETRRQLFDKLRSLSLETPISFDSFADELIQTFEIDTPNRNPEIAKMFINSLIEYTIITPLDELGVLMLETDEAAQDGSPGAAPKNFVLTELGRAFLEIKPM
jgi:hypothetical protein